MSLKKEVFVERLLEWRSKFFKHEDFPWRLTNDPFRILVAEVLLRKTTREQVSKLYEDFIKKYPTPEALASAPIQSIENNIKSLGIEHKRALLLKRLGETLTKKYGGVIPSTREKLLKLPSVGEYTANAVLCFAYGKDAPLVDTNVARIMDRVFSIKYIKTSRRSIRRLWNKVAQMVPQGRAREFNLSLLDFANHVCTARKPRCEICIIQDICDYYKAH